jgi:hypothetical protein
MFYKAFGYVVWNLGVAYLRRRYGRRIKVAIVVGIASVATAGYLATRSGEST